MAKHLEFGQQGEREAQEFLRTQGYQILQLNWRYKWWEVDIIAKEGDILAFIEVKSRSSTQFGEPFQFVDLKKQKNLIKAAGVFLKRINHRGDIRFDIVSIYSHNGKKDISLVKDAFWGSYS
ncbi:YraN family protein [Sphingobacterium sp. DN00404]|uniref:UPF0102 protein H8B06_10120 n=1 Tax=Sphingobacterium micropteri TaxID=2763501 RepID=A0ABR7YPF3_9SPHI|nr:YraN family protein [Sphingobacterium micropteri]MBD1433182.1 YraN family protein [Sphingobacterium micropteri]